MIERPEVFRQSLLQGFTTCPRRTKHGLLVDSELATGWVGATGDVGRIFHEFMRRYLLAIAAEGEPRMPTQEAIEVLYEVLGEAEVPLPWDSLDDLRWLVLSFCDIGWPVPLRILALEEPLTAEIECPDGVVRVLKGQPDIVIADPPNGIIIPDAKSGRGRPKGPRVEPEQGEVVEGREYLSDTFQGDVYSYLGLRRYVAAERAIFREFHVRSKQIRQATMGRGALEHVERKLAATMMLLDRAISEGEESPLWRPRPGSHCTRRCPVAVSCPVPREMRGDGSIESPEQADAAARAWSVLEGVREALRGSLKAFVEDPENPVPAANEREVVSWNPPTGRGRRFGIWDRREFETENGGSK